MKTVKANESVSPGAPRASVIRPATIADICGGDPNQLREIERLRLEERRRVRDDIIQNPELLESMQALYAGTTASFIRVCR